MCPRKWDSDASREPIWVCFFLPVAFLDGKWYAFQAQAYFYAAHRVIIVKSLQIFEKSDILY